MSLTPTAKSFTVHVGEKFDKNFKLRQNSKNVFLKFEQFHKLMTLHAFVPREIVIIQLFTPETEYFTIDMFVRNRVWNQRNGYRMFCH